MKTVAVCFGYRLKNRAHGILAEKTLQPYLWLHDIAKERGINVIWTNIQELTEKGFSSYFIWDGKKFVQKKRNIRPDYILDRSACSYKRMPLKKMMQEMAPSLNPPRVQTIAEDKFMTHLMFPDITIPSYLAHSKEELATIAKKYKSIRKWVTKYLRGICGNGVEIASSKNVAKYKGKFPAIMQPFLNSKKGIPGLFKGIHDLRVVCLDHKPVQAYIRTPAKGTELCNIAQGGKRIFIPLSDLPTSAKKLVKQVTTRLRPFQNTLYSVDMLYLNRSTPKLIEMNHNPTTEMTPGHEKEVKKFVTKLVDHIEKYI